MSLRQEIDAFLAVKRIAVVGVSTDPKDFSRAVFRDLLSRGYDAVPVNPKGVDIEGRRCYASVREIEPPAEGALIMTPADQTAHITEECFAAGIKHVWMHRGGGQGAVNREAVEFCHEHGIGVVPGECPYMFLEGSGFPHNVHGWIRRTFHAELR